MTPSVQSAEGGWQGDQQSGGQSEEQKPGAVLCPSSSSAVPESLKFLATLFVNLVIVYPHVGPSLP